MEITPELIYAVSVMDGVRRIFGAIGVLALVAVCAVAAVVAVTWGDEEAINIRAWRRTVTIAACTAAVSLLLQAAIPSKETVAAMIVIPAIANPEAIARAEKPPVAVLDAAKRWLDALAKKD